MVMRRWYWLGVAVVSSASGAVAGPEILAQSGDMQVRAGGYFTAYVKSAGDGLAHRWMKNGTTVPAANGDTLVVAAGAGSAGSYQVAVSNSGGETLSEPMVLTVIVAPPVGVAAGGRGIVSVPDRLAYYDLALPTNYASGEAFPVLFTFAAGGGGMVGHFRTVAEQKKWIVIGVNQSQNGQGSLSKIHFTRAVIEHALANLKIDPNRIFVAGFSGGGWTSFDAARQNAPLVAGTFSMGGWLGYQYPRSPSLNDRDMLLSGLLVARANGDADTNANYFLVPDRQWMSFFLQADDIKDWSFSGGHAAAPAAVQREVFDWFTGRITASTSEQRDLAKRQESLWKARVTAGDGLRVYEEIGMAAFDSPRTPLALAAWWTLDFLYRHPSLFLRKTPSVFAGYPRRNFFQRYLVLNMFAYLQDRDPARQLSGTAAAHPFGTSLKTTFQDNYWDEAHSIFRHPPRSAFDAYVLDNALYERPELPLLGDWDGDGRDNFREFVLGSDPLLADAPASADLRVVNGEVFAAAPSAQTGALMGLVPMVTDHPAGQWVAAVGGEWLQARAGRDPRVNFGIGTTAGFPRRFVRFEPSFRTSMWNDANGDGIPYQHVDPEYQWPGNGTWGDLANLPDLRQTTEMPGGVPLYRRYLTAAEIGHVSGLGSSLRYHPALAGYRGYLVHEVWMNVPASSLAGAAAVIAGRAPNDLRLITTTQAPWFNGGGSRLIGDNYLERTRGYVVPTVTGTYVFSIAAADQGELWLSSDEDPAKAVLVAQVASASGFQNYTQTPPQTSAAIQLIAGQSYYLEILHQQGTGADHCSVAWIRPGTSARLLIPSANLRCLPAHLVE